MTTMLDTILTWCGRAPAARRSATSSGRFRMLLAAIDPRGGGWCDAPPRLSAQRGDTVSLRVDVAPDLDVRWTGAREIAATLRSSTARARLREPGRHPVRAEILDATGRRLCALDTVVEVRR